MVEVNKINEIYSGHYQVILDFPSPGDLKKILEKSYRYVWGVEHNEGRSSWLPYDYSLYGTKLNNDSIVYSRNISMEFLIDTSKFIELLPNIKQTLKIVQTNIMPPSFLDLNRLNGKAKYDLLRSKIDYLFEIEMPGAIDYATLVSSDINFLNRVIKNFDI